MCIIGDCGISLPVGHKICIGCAAAVKCNGCSRYLRRDRFTHASEACDTCVRKNMYQRQQGGAGTSYGPSQQSYRGVLTTHSLHTSVHDRDIQGFMRISRAAIHDILQQDLARLRCTLASIIIIMVIYFLFACRAKINCTTSVY